MKRALLKDTFKEIKNTKKRFISILLMAFLGVGFFAGIKATSPDMQHTIDRFYDKNNVYDIEIISTLGLTNEDIESLEKVDGVKQAYGIYSTDVAANIDEEEIILKVYSIDENINKTTLISGNMPNNYDECIVEEGFLKNNNLKIGDYIELDTKSSEETFKETSVKIVGTISSPLYISRDRGTTKLGNGTIDYCMYVSKENISNPIYTQIYIVAKDSQELNTCSQKYKDYINDIKSKVESIKEEREQSRYDQIVAEAQAEVDKAKEELNIQNQKQDFEKSIAEAEDEIEKAIQEISKIEKAKWYILDRYNNSGFSGFVQDTQSVANIGKVFPIVFFIIAILISLTSMTRMVEEQRGEIGTLKTLGYTGVQIANKYIIYALLASIIGGSIGMSVGFIIIPKVIWKMYSLMYNIPNFIPEFNLFYGLAGLLVITICILGATIFSIMKEIKQMPAVLMRPKAPTNGKRVWLENIKFIWNKLNFIKKVTVRNMFRYKKRFLLTIIGIFGCTSLIVAGFGIRDSITHLIPEQYTNIFKYNMMITTKNDLTDEEMQEFIINLENKEQIENVVETYMTSLDIYKENKEPQSVELVVPRNNEDFDIIIGLYDKKTNTKLELNSSGIIITDKLAELIGANIGDTVILRDADGKEIEATVGGITKNYINHYVYMSQDLYNTLYGDYLTNVLYTKNIELSQNEEETLSKEIIDTGFAGGVTTTSYIKGFVDDMMSSLNYVVIVLIVSSGLLAFVVLYNLANVNISERIRELATIKVLGFYDNEVYQYLNRETIILTIIGIILGLVGGYFLNYFIMGTCEINILRFDKIINVQSYIYAILITIAFTLIVNIFTYITLKRIKMIESLKSVE